MIDQANSRHSRLFTQAALSVAILTAAGCAPLGRLSPLASLERSIIYQPTSYPNGNWQPQGLDFEDAWFEAADGKRHRILYHSDCVYPFGEYEESLFERNRNAFVKGKALLDERVDNLLLAVAHQQERYGLAYLDLSSGRFRVLEVSGDEALTGELQRLDPAETLYCNTIGHPAITGRRGAREQPEWEFDEASARYAEFGPFYTSYIKTPAEMLDHCLGQPSA